MFNNTKTFPDFFQSNHYENIHTLVIQVLQNSNCENKDSQHGEKNDFCLTQSNSGVSQKTRSYPQVWLQPSGQSCTSTT